MSRLKRLLIAIIPLFMIWISACVIMTGPIETDLAERALEAVRQGGHGLDHPSVTISGRDATLSGTALDPQGNRDGVVAANDTFGVRLVNSRVAFMPVADPYLFGVRHDDNRLVLSGSVPNSAARESLIAAARASIQGIEVIDKMSDAGGAPEGFLTIAGYGLAQAARLAGGTFSLSNKSYSISGMAATSESYEALMAEITNLPGGATLAEASIQPPEVKPYFIEAASDGASLTLTGSVPSVATRQEIAAQAAASAPGATLVNHLAIARGGPQGDFAAAMTFALAELAKLSRGSVSLSDGHLSITGVGKDGVSAETVDADARIGLPVGFDLADNRVVASEAAVPATLNGGLPTGLVRGDIDSRETDISPYVFEAVKRGDTVTLTGHFPDESTHEQILAAAHRMSPGFRLVDQLEPGKGEPDDFAAATSFAIAELGKLSQGTARLSDSSFSITGTGNEDVSADTFEADVQTGLPKRFAPAVIQVLAAEVHPFVFQARKTEQGVALSGFAPSAAARDSVLATARAVAGAGLVSGTLKLASGLPAEVDFERAAGLALAELGRLSRGTASLIDNTLAVTGDAADAAAADAARALLTGVRPAGIALGDFDIREPLESRASDADVSIKREALHPKAASETAAGLLSAVQKGFRTTAKIRVVPRALHIEAVDCQLLLNDIIEHRKIRFATGMATIKKPAFRLLHKLVAAAKRCPEAKLEVAGYTDSRGRDQNNRKLSRHRSKAVVHYLIENGIDARRLHAVGYGKANPIASNNNRYGRARNRRIEFQVTYSKRVGK